MSRKKRCSIEILETSNIISLQKALFLIFYSTQKTMFLNNFAFWKTTLSKYLNKTFVFVNDFLVKKFRRSSSIQRLWNCIENLFYCQIVFFKWFFFTISSCTNQFISFKHFSKKLFVCFFFYSISILSNTIMMKFVFIEFFFLVFLEIFSFIFLSFRFFHHNFNSIQFDFNFDFIWLIFSGSLDLKQQIFWQTTKQIFRTWIV